MEPTDKQLIEEGIEKRDAADAPRDEELFERLKALEGGMSEPSGVGFWWLLGGTAGAIALIIAVGNVLSPSPSTVELERPTMEFATTEEPEAIGHTEEQYQLALQLAIKENERILNNLTCATTRTFQADAYAQVSEERISERAAILQKLNFTISMLDRALAQQGFFSGEANSRGAIRAPILDSQAALMALAGHGRAEDCAPAVARYVEALENLSHWGNRLEAQREEWQRRQPSAPPTSAWGNQ